VKRTTPDMSQTKVTFRLNDEVVAEIERIRISQHYSSQVECMTALILSGAARVNGLIPSELQAAVMTDARVGGAVADAIAEVRMAGAHLSESPYADSQIADGIAKTIEHLRFAQDVILEAQAARIPAADKPTAERLRIRGGGDDWKAAERGAS
jgi:hypothetical protein